MDLTIFLLMLTTCVMPCALPQSWYPLSAAVIMLMPLLLHLCTVLLAMHMEPSSLTMVRDLTCALHAEYAKLAASLSFVIRCLFQLAGVFIRECITCMKDSLSGLVKSLKFLTNCLVLYLTKLILGNTVTNKPLSERQLSALSELSRSRKDSKRSTAQPSSKNSRCATYDDIWNDGVLSNSE